MIKKQILGEKSDADTEDIAEVDEELAAVEVQDAEEDADKSGEEGEGDDDDDDDDEDEEEEDPIDPYETAREKCAETKQCAELMDLFNECETRVKSKSHTEENCSQEILDFFHCQDACAAKGLFAKLK